MSLNRLIIIFTLPSFLAGCAGFSGTQPPAPVYVGQQKIQKPSVSQRDIKTPSEDIEIQPIKEPSEIKAEPLQPSAVSTPLGEPPTETQGSLPLDMPLSDLPESSSPSSDSTSLEKPGPALTPPDTTTSEAISPEKTEPATHPELTPFEPIETTGTLPPAVDALVLAADKSSKTGDIDSADALIERAVRIEPRNAALFYKLAVLRLKQSKPKLAEDLAQKSALLAATDNVLKKNCWLLIAHARELQQDFTGAKEARAKADSFK
jgi:tetratricopeptide (TPR) repeat protein